MKPKIVKFEFHQRSGVGIGGAWKDRPLWYAEIELRSGTLICFSRFESEDEWFADAVFEKNGLPHFVHGEGSRCCAKQIAQGEVKEMLDAAKAAWGDKEPIRVSGL